LSFRASVIGDSMKPGATQLTVMLRLGDFGRERLHMPIRPALEAV
jgi:hypothetical protein